MLHRIYFVLQLGILELEQIKHYTYNMKAHETKAFPVFYLCNNTFSKYCNNLNFVYVREQETQISLHSYNINEFSYTLKLPSVSRLM